MIRNATATGICIGDEVFKRTIALTTDAILDDWPEKAIEDLTESDFTPLLDSRPAVIVLGTGASNIFPPRELVFALARRGIGLEFMDTAAAARTYNVLASEGRQVAAILYL